MFGIGMPELLVILVVALIVLGPKKLPDVAKGLARGLAEFKKATQEIKQNIELDEDLREIKQTFDDEMRKTMYGKPAPLPAATAPEPEEGLDGGTGGSFDVAGALPAEENVPSATSEQMEKAEAAEAGEEAPSTGKVAEAEEGGSEITLAGLETALPPDSHAQTKTEAEPGTDPEKKAE